MSRKNRRASRKASRKASRRNRRGSRRDRRASRRCWSRRNNAQMGGMPVLSPAGVNDETMMFSSSQNLAQGRDYQEIHADQHGGAAVSLDAAAPVGYTGMLDDSLRATARIGPLDQAIGAIQGMSDQSGGGRRRRRGKSMKMRGKQMYMQFMGMVRHPLLTSRKLSKAALKKIAKTLHKKRRRQRGGAGYSIGPTADYASPGMLLPSDMEAKALMGMNPEWKLAADPGSFAPNMG